MRRWLLTFALLFVSSALNAQDGVELFGYYESQLMGTQLKSDFYQLYSNKLRVDLQADLSDNVSFAANYTYITYHGKTTWNILDFLASDVTAEIPGILRQVYVLPFADRNYLDNAYLKLAFKNFDLMMGKQQISLGTGYAWNPIDIFNTKDLLDPTYEQPGHNGIRLDIPIGLSHTFTALYAPGEDWKDTGRMVQLKGRLSHFDYSFIAIEKIWRFHDYMDFDDQSMYFTELPEKRQLLGFCTVGEILGIGVWAEYAHNNMEYSENFYELVIGSDYTFDFQTYIMLEYYRNTLGKSNYQDYNLNDWMRMLAFEQKAISQDQLYGYIQHPITDFLTIAGSTIFSISDKSLALVPTLQYSFSQDVEILAYLNLNFGTEGKVFSKDMGNGGLLRARVYF